MSNQKLILITGSKGFVGTNLIKGLRERNLTNLALPTKGNEVYAIEAMQPQVVIHLAGCPLIGEDSQKIFDSNLVLTWNILQSLPQDCHFVFASSATVYGHCNRPLIENDLCEPESIYGAVKLACEELIKAKGRSREVFSTILRMVANCGPHATHGIVPDLVRKLKSDSEYLDLLGCYPGSWKPIMHISDTVSAIIHVINDKLYDTFNVSYDSNISVYEIADIIVNTMQHFKPFRWLGDEFNWKGDTKVVEISAQKLKSTGWVPQYTNREAIVKVVKECMT
jgi:nucleoside-diphosphate-sugar epimerase